MKAKTRDRREGSRGDGILYGWQEERMEVDHVNNMALGSSTMPAVSLFQFKLPPQNPFAAEGASAYWSGLRAFLHVLIINLIFACFLCFINDYHWK